MSDSGATGDHGEDPRVVRALARAIEQIAAPGRAWLFERSTRHVLFVHEQGETTRNVVKIPYYGGRPEGELGAIECRLLSEAQALETARTHVVPELVGFAADGSFLIRSFEEGAVLSVKKRLPPDLCRERVGGVLRTAREAFSSFHHHPAGPRVLFDFKPQNLIVPETPARFLKLIDLGGVRPEGTIGSDTPLPIQLGTRKGLHRAPEQLGGRMNELDRRIDYFAVGSIVASLLLGRPPYSNSVSGYRGALSQYLREYQGVTRELRGAAARLEVPSDVIGFVLRSMHPLRNERPSEFEATLGD